MNCYWFLLFKKGAAYKCYCTKLRLDLIRKNAVKHGEIPRYDNKCRHLTEKEILGKTAERVPYVIRFKVRKHSIFWSWVEDLSYLGMQKFKDTLGICFVLKLSKVFLLLFKDLITLCKHITFTLITKFKSKRSLSYLSLNWIKNLKCGLTY